jgi:hypothetical protein
MWSRSARSEAIEGTARTRRLPARVAQAAQGVSDRIDDVADFDAHVGQFTLQHDRRAVSVLVSWFPLAQHRFWVPAQHARRGHPADCDEGDEAGWT